MKEFTFDSTLIKERLYIERLYTVKKAICAIFFLSKVLKKCSVYNCLLVKKVNQNYLTSQIILGNLNTCDVCLYHSTLNYLHNHYALSPLVNFNECDSSFFLLFYFHLPHCLALCSKSGINS